jgi:hypothetical protein
VDVVLSAVSEEVEEGDGEGEDAGEGAEGGEDFLAGLNVGVGTPRSSVS